MWEAFSERRRGCGSGESDSAEIGVRWVTGPIRAIVLVVVLVVILENTEQSEDDDEDKDEQEPRWDVFPANLLCRA